jgi:hypothetical protein
VSAGLAVVGAGVGTIFGVQMLSKKSDAQSHADSATGRCLDVQCQTSSHDAVTAGNIATVGWVAAGALAATGVALWLTAPSGVRAEVVPAPAFHGGAVVLRGRF